VEKTKLQWKAPFSHRIQITIRLLKRINTTYGIKPECVGMQIETILCTLSQNLKPILGIQNFGWFLANIIVYYSESPKYNISKEKKNNYLSATLQLHGYSNLLAVFFIADALTLKTALQSTPEHAIRIQIKK